MTQCYLLPACQFKLDLGCQEKDWVGKRGHGRADRLLKGPVKRQKI